MDRHTLTVIVITAVVTETAKLLVRWGYKNLKMAALIATLSASVRKWLIKEVFSVGVDILALAVIVYMAIRFFGNEEPATKQDLLTALGLIFAFGFFGLILVIDLFKLGLRRVKEEREAKEKAKSIEIK